MLRLFSPSVAGFKSIRVTERTVFLFFMLRAHLRATQAIVAKNADGGDRYGRPGEWIKRTFEISIKRDFDTRTKHVPEGNLPSVVAR